MVDLANTDNNTGFIYAGFWKRFGAALIDSMFMNMVFLLVIVATSFLVDDEQFADVQNILEIIFFISSIAYFVIMESSKYQATFGKMAAGIKVTKIDGQRISLLRGLGRYLAKIISTIPLCIGFLLPIFTKKKQALHDIIAKTIVIKTGYSYFWRIMAITFVLHLAILAGCGYYI